LHSEKLVVPVCPHRRKQALGRDAAHFRDQRRRPVACLVAVCADNAMGDLRLVFEEVFKPQHARSAEGEPPAVE